MNENNNWYDQSQVYNWYAAPEAPKTPAPPPKKPRRKRTGLKITMIIILVLMLIVGTVYIFADGINSISEFIDSIEDIYDGEIFPDEEIIEPEIYPDFPFDDFFDGIIPEFDGEFEVIIPGDGEKPAPDEEEDTPRDFRDFFEGYFTKEDTIAPSNIPRAEAKGDFVLDLQYKKDGDFYPLDVLYNLCANSVVAIKAEYDDEQGYGWGSGVVLSTDGYIVTNAHVISEADKCTVVLMNGRECDALLVGEDSQTDLAVLKVNAKGLVPADFGNSDELRVGESVFAIGNPLGEEFSHTLTNGIISAIDRHVDYSGTNMPLIQTNTALNEGNSGGPLFNMYGQVIGITNMKMSNEYGVTIEGIGFAIPSTTVKKVVDQIIENGKVMGRPGIGITCGSVPEEAMEEYGLPEGLYITDVSEDSDAKAKGILPGDVLTHINGQKVLTTEDVLEIRDAHQIGDVLRFTIFRDGKTFDVDVEIYDLGNIY